MVYIKSRLEPEGKGFGMEKAEGESNHSLTLLNYAVFKKTSSKCELNKSS